MQKTSHILMVIFLLMVISTALFAQDAPDSKTAYEAVTKSPKPAVLTFSADGKLLSQQTLPQAMSRGGPGTRSNASRRATVIGGESRDVTHIFV
jgi:hypothetical protein